MNMMIFILVYYLLFIGDVYLDEKECLGWVIFWFGYKFFVILVMEVWSVEF